MAWHVQNGHFCVLCGKKYASWKKKTTPAMLVALVTNYSYTWWTHFQPVEGCTYLKDLSESLGDFRVAKCLHCDMLVRRGKPGCTARETTNATMASHMRTKHSALALQVMLFFGFFVVAIFIVTRCSGSNHMKDVYRFLL